MIRYFGIYSRRSKGKVNFIKMMDKRILSIRRSIENWENRILAISGVNPCKCPNCGNEDKTKMSIIVRLCGYISSISERPSVDCKMKEINNRITHIGERE